MQLRRFAVGAVLAAYLAGCTGATGGVRIEGPAPLAIPWSGQVYVEDWRSEPRQRPGLMDLTELTTLDYLTWRDWGSPQAIATGWVIDLACTSGCPGDAPPSYQVRVVLSGLVKRRYAAYYSHAAVTAVTQPTPNWAEDVTSVRLYVPKA